MTEGMLVEVGIYKHRNKTVLGDWKDVDWSGDATYSSEDAWCPQTVRWHSLGLPYKAMLECIMPVATSLWHSIWRPYVSYAKADSNGQALPACLSDMCDKFLRDARGRSQMFKQCLKDKQIFLDHSVLDLLELHDGEVVEVPRERTAPWMLAFAENLSGYEALPEQFDLGPHYRPPKMNHFHRWTADWDMRVSSDHSIVERNFSYADLQPDWKKQSNRLSVPCRGTSQFIWVRHRSVITLGELMQTLHSNFSKDCIYHFYLRLDIVASMQQKPERLSKKRLRNQI